MPFRKYHPCISTIKRHHYKLPKFLFSCIIFSCVKHTQMIFNSSTLHTTKTFLLFLSKHIDLGPPSPMWSLLIQVVSLTHHTLEGMTAICEWLWVSAWFPLTILLALVIRVHVNYFIYLVIYGVNTNEINNNLMYL